MRKTARAPEAVTTPLADPTSSFQSLAMVIAATVIAEPESCGRAGWFHGPPADTNLQLPYTWCHRTL